MPKKEELGYGMIIVFVLAALFFIALMLPFDTATGSTVLDYTDRDLGNLFFGAPFIDFIVLVAVGILIVGGSLELASQSKAAERTLETLPRMSRIELRAFVRESIDMGYKKEDISETLLAQGWDRELVEAVLRVH